MTGNNELLGTPKPESKEIPREAKEFKENSEQEDIIFTLPPSNRSTGTQNLPELELRSEFSLGALMQAAEIEIPSFVAMLEDAHTATMEALLNDEVFVKKLSNNCVRLIAHYFPTLVVSKEDLYTQLGTLEVFWLVLRSRVPILSKILETPDLFKFLNGQKLFKLTEKCGDENFYCLQALQKIIKADTDLNKKYKAYSALQVYRLPHSKSLDETATERQKISDLVQEAGIELSDITTKDFENSAVKEVLKSTPQELDKKNLYNLASTDEEFALLIMKNPVLCEEFSRLNTSYLLDLSKKSSSVCLAILHNEKTSQFFSGYDLFGLREYYKLSNPSASQEILETVNANTEMRAKKDAYSALWSNYNSDKTSFNEQIEGSILSLLAQAGLSTRVSSSAAEKNLSGTNDLARESLFYRSKQLAFFLLKNKFPFPRLYLQSHYDPQSYHNLKFIDLLLFENKDSFNYLFDDISFLNNSLPYAEKISLFVLDTPNLAKLLTGNILNKLVEKHGPTVLEKILQSPTLIDKYRAYSRLYQLAHQAGVTVARKQTCAAPAMSTEQAPLVNQDYERGVFALEQGRPDIAFDYFDKAAKANYEPAVLILKNIRLYIKPPQLLKIPANLLSAKAFSNPTKPCYKEAIATHIYTLLYQYINSHDRCGRYLSTEIHEVTYHLARRSALGLGKEPEQEFADSLFVGLCGNREEERQQLINCCLQDLQNRQKTTAAHQEQKRDNPTKEPAIVFLENKITTTFLSYQEKATRYIELYEFYFKAGNLVEAIRLLKAAIALPTAIEAKHYAQLADLQKTLALGQKTQTHGLNEALSNYLKALEKTLKDEAEQKYIIELAQSPEAAESKKSSDVEVEEDRNPAALLDSEIKKASQDKNQRYDHITQIEALIKLICCDDEEKMDTSKQTNLSPENAAAILSLPCLCATLVHSDPEILYAISLRCDPPQPPALPLAPLPASVTNDKEKSLDTEPASDYISDLLEWASEEQKGTDPNVDPCMAASDQLFVLTEAFLNANVKEKSTRENYQKYFHAGLGKLFKKLHLNYFDPEKNVISQIYATAEMCERNPQIQPYAQKFLTLAERLLNNELEDFLESDAQDISQKVNALKEVLININYPPDRNIFTERAMQAVLKHPDLCASLPQEILTTFASQHLDETWFQTIILSREIGRITQLYPTIADIYEAPEKKDTLIAWLLDNFIRPGSSNEQKTWSFLQPRLVFFLRHWQTQLSPAAPSALAVKNILSFLDIIFDVNQLAHSDSALVQNQ